MGGSVGGSVTGVPLCENISSKFYNRYTLILPS